MVNYELKCMDCNAVLGTTSIQGPSNSICSLCALARANANSLQTPAPTFEERLTLIEADIVKVTDVMVSKGDLASKDISVEIEPIGLEEELIP
jgi:hypothetical protein